MPLTISNSSSSSSSSNNNSSKLLDTSAALWELNLSSSANEELEEEEDDDEEQDGHHGKAETDRQNRQHAAELIAHHVAVDVNKQFHWSRSFSAMTRCFGDKNAFFKMQSSLRASGCVRVVGDHHDRLAHFGIHSVHQLKDF